MLSVRREDKRPLDCALFFPYFSKLTWNFFKPTSFSNLPIPSNQYKLVLNHFKPIQVNTKSSIPIKVHQINRAHSKMRSKSKKPIQINANSSKIHSNVSSQYNLTQNSVQSPKTRSSPIISIQNHKVPFKHVKPIHSHPKIRSSLDKQVKSYSNLSNQYKLIPKCIQSPKFRSKSKIPFKVQNSVQSPKSIYVIDESLRVPQDTSKMRPRSAKVNTTTLTSCSKNQREQNHSTQDSRVVPHRGTNWAALWLTAQIGRDAVLSESYGRG